MSLSIDNIRKSTPQIVVRGAHQKIIQSILDFDYLSGRADPSVIAIISAGKKHARFFFGNQEILIPVFKEISDLDSKAKKTSNFLLNLNSGRRVLSSTEEGLKTLPNLIGVSIFAERVPERHSLELIDLAKKYQCWIVGPSSVGITIPGWLKLGAIGGIQHRQITNSGLTSPGQVAVMSSSGGMTNELINMLAMNSVGISFALSFGGDLFPALDPKQAFLAAQADLNTKAVVYFGELGGNDEQELVQLIEEKKFTKPVYAYIAGSVAELFDEPPQFGHAKAMAKTQTESAIEKRNQLKSVGVNAASTFAEFNALVSKIEHKNTYNNGALDLSINSSRKEAPFISRLAGSNKDNELTLAGHTLAELSKAKYGYVLSTLLLGKNPNSNQLPDLLEKIMILLADHGPQVSGAVNTMVTARAGKDLPSSLAAGLLTIGPKFGGAVSGAARLWVEGVREDKSAGQFVEYYAKQNIYLQGIGHKKYRLENPDPRINLLIGKKTKAGPHLQFARKVEKITTNKNSSLILNIDGAIAAVLLDTLLMDEKMTETEIDQLIDIEFFNALFVLARSLGLTAHFLDQKRIDEGLFRLDDELLSTLQR